MMKNSIEPDTGLGESKQTADWVLWKYQEELLQYLSTMNLWIYRQQEKNRLALKSVRLSIMVYQYRQKKTPTTSAHVQTWPEKSKS